MNDLDIYIYGAVLITILLTAITSFNCGRDYQRKLESVRRKIRFLNHETPITRPSFLPKSRQRL